MALSRPPLSLKGRALRYLAAREHSRAELQRKLTPHVQETDDLPALLDYLEAQGWISQTRVMESVLHRRADRLGTARIRQELQAKGLDTEVVQEAVARLQNTELERAQAVWEKRFGQAPANAHERLRQMRFLAARGFSSEAVRRAVPRSSSS